MTLHCVAGSVYGTHLSLGVLVDATFFWCVHWVTRVVDMTASSSALRRLQQRLPLDTFPSLSPPLLLSLVLAPRLRRTLGGSAPAPA